MWRGNFHHDGLLFAQGDGCLMGLGEVRGMSDDTVAGEGEGQPLTAGGVLEDLGQVDGLHQAPLSFRMGLFGVAVKDCWDRHPALDQRFDSFRDKLRLGGSA